MKKLNVYMFKNNVINFKDCLKESSERRQYVSIKDENIDLGFDYDLYLIEGLPKKPKWLKFIEQYSNRERIENVENKTNSLIILLRINTDEGDRIFAICEGFGFHVIDRARIEGNFGLKTALNSIDPLKVKSMDVKSLGIQTLQRREASNLATDFNEFGFEFDADILRIINGDCTDPVLGTRIGGSDNLIITSDLSFEQLAEKCTQIYRMYRLDTYRRNFEFIDYIQFEKDPATTSALDTLLLNAINDRVNDLRISIAYPDQIDYERSSSFNITGWREGEELIDVNLEGIYRFIDENAPGGGLHSVEELKKNIRIVGLDTNDQPVTRLEPVYEYLSFEVDYEGSRYVLSNGKWYRLEGNYIARIDAEIRRLAHVSDVPLLPWPVETPGVNRHTEGYYNGLYADQPDFLYLDKNLYRFDGSRSSVEVADLFFRPSKKLVCVKRLDRSATLSHLFSQASVSGSLFKDSAQYREVFIQGVTNKWPELAGDITNEFLSDLTFVYAIGTDRADEIYNVLPIFSKINLLKHIRILNRYGFATEIVKIDLVD